MSRPRSRKANPPPGRPPVVDREAAALAAVRLAILLVVLLLGGAAWLLGGRGTDPGAAESFRTVVVGAWILGGGGIAVLRLVAWRRAATPAQRRKLTVIGWSLGEMPALAGAAYLWATGDARFFFAGLFALLLSFFVFAAPLERR